MRVTVPLILALFVTCAACAGANENGINADGLVQSTRTAMARESFSHRVTDCRLCDDQPELTEFAPPNRIKLSGSNGHDDWPYYLVIGTDTYLSGNGERWLVGRDHAAAGMLLSDPRVLLSVLTDADVDARTIDGRGHYFLTGSVDPEALVRDYLLELEDVTETEAELVDEARKLFEGMTLGFLIDGQRFRVIKLEVVDWPADREQEGPGASALEFDYETPIHVPEEPASMTREEAKRLESLAEGGGRVIMRALDRYKQAHGTYPERVDMQTLGAQLDDIWPINPFTDEPIKRVLEDSPGDFSYELKSAGEDYRLSLYGWDSIVFTRDTTWCPDPCE